MTEQRRKTELSDHAGCLSPDLRTRATQAFADAVELFRILDESGERNCYGVAALENARGAARASLRLSRHLSVLQPRVTDMRAAEPVITKALVEIGERGVPRAVDEAIKRLEKAASIPELGGLRLNWDRLQSFVAPLGDQDAAVTVEKNRVVVKHEGGAALFSLGDDPTTTRGLARLVTPSVFDQLATVDPDVIDQSSLTFYATPGEQRPIALKDALIVAPWSLAQALHTRFRMLEDQCGTVAEGDDGGASALATGIGVAVTIIMLIGFLASSAGTIISVLCYTGEITDADICTAGDWLMGIGSALMLVGLGAAGVHSAASGGPIEVRINEVPVDLTSVPSSVPPI